MALTNNGKIYEFADFRLDPAENLLLRNGEAISMKPKAFSALVLLVENHGNLVEKSELMNRIWGDSFVEESAVSKCIWSIRAALGDGSKDQKFIQTVPKRGYRFVSEVAISQSKNGDHAIEASAGAFDHEHPKFVAGSNVLPIHSRSNAGHLNLASETIAATERFVSYPVSDPHEALHIVPASNPLRRSSKYYAVAILVFLVMGVAGGYYLLNRPSPIATIGPARIAVLPLKPVAAENRDAIIEFAVAESLIIKLSMSPNLSVRPLSDVRKYVELDRDPIEAGKELNTDYVLSSNYQVIDGKIRVTSQLFNTATRKTEATFKSESGAENKFELQDAVANEIGNALFKQFGQTGESFTAKRGTENEAAYRLYLQGQYLVEKKKGPDAIRAIELFDQALEIDPNYANAWAGKANAHCTSAHVGGIEPKVAFASAKPALKRAFELDPNSAEAHAVRGIITFDYDWKFEEGLEHLRRARELDPNHEWARRAYARRVALIGRTDEGLAEIKTAIDISPSSVFNQFDYADILYQARRYDEAIAQLQRVLEMDGPATWVSNRMWVNYHMKGDYERAYTWFLKFHEDIRTAPAEIDAYRQAYAMSGWASVLKLNAKNLEARRREGQFDPFARPVIQLTALVGDYDAAFDYLKRSVRFQELWIPSMFHDPAYDGLRQDPRFGKILREAGIHM